VHDRTNAANNKICAEVLMILNSSLLFEMGNSYDIRVLPNCEANRKINVTPNNKKAEPPIYFGNPEVFWKLMGLPR